MSAPEASGVRFAQRGDLGLVVLDRPAALNALTHGMVQAMSRQLAVWRDDPRIGAVLVTAVPGRAFCAGGDVRAASRAWLEGGAAAAMPFFADEYELNWRIATSPKPYVALIDGVTMGGGVGISVHGTRCVATERTLVAMPETAIGMFPDVGGTVLLGQRCAGGLGAWLGLTGARLDAAGCLAAGIAQVHVPAARCEALVAALAATPLAGLDKAAATASIDAVLAGFATAAGADPLTLLRARIEACFAAPDLATLLADLAAEPSGWGAEQLAILRRHSPFAVRLTHEQLRRAPGLDFAAAMRMEYRMVHRVFAQGDFHEGVRALLVDKDRQPRWAHAALEAVPEALIAGCFAPLAPPTPELVLDWVVD